MSPIKKVMFATTNTTADPNQRVCKYRTIECCTDVKSDPCFFFSNEVVHSFCCLEARANSAAKSQMDDLSQENNLPMALSALCYHYLNEDTT